MLYFQPPYARLYPTPSPSPRTEPYSYKVPYCLRINWLGLQKESQVEIFASPGCYLVADDVWIFRWRHRGWGTYRQRIQVGQYCQFDKNKSRNVIHACFSTPNRTSPLRFWFGEVEDTKYDGHRKVYKGSTIAPQKRTVEVNTKHLSCPRCGTRTDIKKNGFDKYSRQLFFCKNCHRGFSSQMIQETSCGSNYHLEKQQQTDTESVVDLLSKMTGTAHAHACTHT